MWFWRRGGTPKPNLTEKQPHTVTTPIAYKYKHSHPHTQHKDTEGWMRYTHSHSPNTLHTPRSRYRYPRGPTSTRTQEMVPFIPGWRPPDQTKARHGTTQTTKPRPRL
ncbi:hypothetical protein ILYODFUR_038088 [Ilyodon furcidens]|uniref:Uncharacterized protein n=1 Tax=Ilyodon furcidens TaxID=33524 RepID=A0ABV0UPQ3_9TELE